MHAVAVPSILKPPKAREFSKFLRQKLSFFQKALEKHFCESSRDLPVGQDCEDPHQLFSGGSCPGQLIEPPVHILKPRVPGCFRPGSLKLPLQFFERPEPCPGCFSQKPQCQRVLKELFFKQLIQVLPFFHI